MDQYDKDLLFRLYIQGYVECAALKKKWHKVIFSSPKQKSSFIEFKSIGNMYYAGREYRKALICYNKALCHAVKGSEDVGVLFSNRSAVAFEMKLYPECMKNIQLARENNYPKDNLLKLKKREEKCMEMISSMKTLPNGNDSENLIDLLYGSLQWPYMIDCLEIVHKKNENPYLITKRDLKAGDMIAKDKPFVGILSENNLNINCFNCMKECILDLIPCDKCALVMFCSENCKESGFQVHQYECGIIDHMISVFGWKSLKEHNKCRALFKALSIFNGSVENLMEFVNETNKSSQEMITLEMCNNEKAFLKAICSINNRSDDDLYIEYFYSFYPKIKEMMANKDFRKFVTMFTKTIPVVIKTELITLTKMNGGYHPLELVLSLSCAPNVFSFILNDSKIIYSVQHPIKAGEKLTIE